MIRKCYARLLDLHPAAFRERFAEEMLLVFDHATGAWEVAFLLLDAMLSLLRQRFLRPHMGGTRLIVAAASGYRSIDTRGPRREALIAGAMLSLLAMWTVVDGMRLGAKGSSEHLVGVHHSRPHLLSIERASLTQTGVKTVVKLAPEVEDPWRSVAVVYFKLMPVLERLDADHDLNLSAWELITAPNALRRLDRDKDGKLSAEECGFHLGSNAGAVNDRATMRARLLFMKFNPVLAALDANLDGTVDAEEMRNSSVSLRSLDRDGDGVLSPREILPDAAANQVGLLLMRLDQDGDGMLSAKEAKDVEDGRLRALILGADRNHDGVSTAAELA